MLNGYPQPRSRAIFPLAIAGIGAFTIYNLKLPSFYSVIGFSLCLLLATVFSRSKSIHSNSTKRILVILSVGFLVTLLFTPTVRAAAITEYYLPPGSTQPYGVTFDITGATYNVWFAEFGSDRIGRKTSAAGYTDTVEFQLTIGSKPYGIARDSSGNIWFTESSRDKIGIIQVVAGPTTELSEYTLPAGTNPHGIAISSFGGSAPVWVAEYGRHAIGLLTFLGFIEYFLPDSNARPESVINLPNSGVWFTELVGDRIGFLSPDGSLLKEWPLMPGSLPHSLSNDTFGNIWFTESGRNRIARLNPYTNEITEYMIPTANAQPFGIVVDGSDNVWFAEHGTGKIGRFTPGTNYFVEFSRPGGAIWDMQLAPDGKVWFSDDAGNHIGRIDASVATTSLTVPAISTASPSSTTATTLGTSTATTSVTAFTPVSTGTFISAGSTFTNVTSATTTSTTSYSASETSSIVRTSTQAVFTSYVTQSLPSTLTSTSYVSTVTATTSVSATQTSVTIQTTTSTTTSTQTSYLATLITTQDVTSTTTLTVTSFALGADIGALVSSLSRGGFLLVSGLMVVGTVGGINRRKSSILRNVSKKGQWKNLGIILLILIMLFAMVLPSKAAAFTEWNLPYGSTAPQGLIFDDQSPRNLWFAEFGSDKVGRLNPSTSEIREIILPAGSRPWEISFETARKEFWFTESGRNIIGRITNYGTGSVDEFPLNSMFPPGYADGPRGLAIQEHVNGTDKPYIWVAEYGASSILRFDPYDKGDAIRYLLSPASGPQSIVFSNEIGLWFTEYLSGRIGNLNPSTRTVREWQIKSDSRPWDLAIDSKNNIWYTDPGRNTISKLNPYTGEIIEYLIPSPACQPYGMVIDSNGWIWFAEHGVNKIGRFVPDDGTFTEYARTTGVSLWGVIQMPGSNILWFGDDSANRLIRFDYSVAITTTTTDILSTASTSRTTLSPIGIITPSPFQTTTIYTNAPTTISYATTTSTTSYQVTQTATVQLTTTTSTSTVYSSDTIVVVGTSTSYSSTTVGTQTTTSTSTMTLIQSSGTTAFGTSTSTALVTTIATVTSIITTSIVPSGIPGFPLESILAGIGLAAVFLIVVSRRRRRRT
jgi:streptogramin lyase